MYTLVSRDFLFVLSCSAKVVSVQDKQYMSNWADWKASVLVILADALIAIVTIIDCPENDLI